MVACSAQSCKVSCVLLPSLCVLAQEMDKTQPICRLCLQIEARAPNKALLTATGIATVSSLSAGREQSSSCCEDQLLVLHRTRPWSRLVRFD